MDKLLELKDDEYIFDDETGDLTITKELAARYDLQNDEYVKVVFKDEDNQVHFPRVKVHKNFYNVRLEYIT